MAVLQRCVASPRSKQRGEATLSPEFLGISSPSVPIKAVYLVIQKESASASWLFVCGHSSCVLTGVLSCQLKCV